MLVILSIMGYKKWFYILSIFAFIGLSFISVSATSDPIEKPVFIPSSPQRIGDSKKGYQYLITGDYLKSGLPFALFKFLNGKEKHNYLHRSGKNAQVPHGFNVINSNGIDIVVPTCLQCHAQEMGDSLVVGLGNSFLDFSNIGRGNGIIKKMVPAIMQTFAPSDYNATKDILRSMTTIAPLMETEVRGVNAADRLATLLVAHRDPITLEWQKTALLNIPEDVIPTDVPAWWLLKKKNAMFYNGFGRGDFGKFLMLSNILTVKDTSEAREVFSHFGDVLAYIQSIQPPKYPNPIDHEIAMKGIEVYRTNCSKCHGTYGLEGSYPNLLIPESIIKTDSMLFKANHQNPQFIEWFNKSWFAQGELPAQLVPSRGYIAPPLDGVWATAPYLHNGSVPTLETLLNSKIRPTFWKRNFQNNSYNYQSIGWDYESLKEPNGKKAYNTTLKGYSNAGHYFGDHLSTDERKALIEYLKTL
jgi:mono/diheme cytochrome c family protein